MGIRALAQTKEGLDNTWSQLGLPGTWWTGAQRIAMAAETRAARECPLCRSRKKALSPYSIDEKAMDNCRQLLTEVCTCGCKGSGKFGECEPDRSNMESLKTYEKELRNELKIVRERMKELKSTAD